MWFPGIDNTVKETTETVSHVKPTASQSIHTAKYEIATPQPWHAVHLDFVVFSDVLVALDAYCHFSEAEIIHSTSAKATITKLKRMFATHGVPQIIKSDNVPQFTSIYTQ